MKGLVLFLAAFLCLNHAAWAQQDPMFTQYVFNPLVYNPAVAGSSGYLEAALLHRSQWMGMDDAPSTQSLSAHTPLGKHNAGVGFSLVADRLGAGGCTDVQASYAYHVPLGKGFRFSVGIQGGVTHWRGDWSELRLENTADVVFRENLNRWAPNAGLGVFLHSDRFFAGFGCPRLFEQDLLSTSGASSGYARTYRHYYMTLGGRFDFGVSGIALRPLALLKTTSRSAQNLPAGDLMIGAPTEIDLGFSLLFDDTFGVGASYRRALQGNASHDSVDLTFAWMLNNGMRFGAAYDIGVSALRTQHNGSLEVMVGYAFDVKAKNVAPIRS
jgi:type IX secretion system PorP/SprF family membrane protein